MAAKKRHHYIPKFYVEGFTNSEGRVYVLDHEKGEISEQSKEGTFHKYKFYTVDFTKYPKRDPESTKRIRDKLGFGEVDTSHIKDYPDMVEDLLGESETVSAPILRKLIEGKELTGKERVELSTFIAFMYTRNPAFHDFVTDFEKQLTEQDVKKAFASKEKVQELYNSMQEDGYEKEIDIDELFSFVQEKRYEIQIPKESNIEIMLMGALVIDKLLHNKTWFVMRAPSNTSFISSDVPVFLDHPNIYENVAYGVGFETPNVKIVFPLSQECLLVMRDVDGGPPVLDEVVNRKQVRELNKLIYFRSKKYAFARDKELLLRLRKIAASFNVEGT